MSKTKIVPLFDKTKAIKDLPNPKKIEIVKIVFRIYKPVHQICPEPSFLRKPTPPSVK